MSCLETEKQAMPFTKEVFKVIASVTERTEEELLSQLCQNSDLPESLHIGEEETVAEQRETAAMIAGNPALNLLTVVEALSRYDQIMKDVRFEPSDRVAMRGELSALPLDFKARTFKIEVLNNVYLRANSDTEVTTNNAPLGATFDLVENNAFELAL